MKKKKRLFAILLAFCVAFTMMPLAGSGGVAHAEDGIAANAVVTRTAMLDLTSTDGKYKATNGKEETVDFTKESVTDSAEGWSWDNETKTLTLSGARIVVTEPTYVPSAIPSLRNGYYYGVLLPGDVTVVLTEGTENIIQAGDATEVTPEGIVIGSVGMGDARNLQTSVTICGSGKLTIKGGKPTNDGNTAARISAGIYSGNVIVKDSAKLEIYGDTAENINAGAYSRGVSCSQMTITDNAQVTAKGGDVRAVNSRESSGISASRPLIIDGSAILKAYGGDVTKNPGASNEWSTSMGICAADFKASANASVYAYGGRTYGDLAGSSMGVYIHKFVSEHSEAKLSENAFLYAEGGQSGGSSYGIYGDRYANQQSLLTIEDNAYIEAVGKEIKKVDETDRSNGISTYGMTINGGTVIASAETQANQDKFAAILLKQPPLPTYAEGLTPTVTAGVSEETATPANAMLEATYANRWVKIQTSESNYAITAVPSVIDFGTVKTGYAQPGSKTVTITNTGNETVVLSEEVLQENSNYTVSKLSESRIAPRRTAEITVQPKENLAAREYNETLTISGSNEVSASVKLKFNVIKSGGSSGGSSYIPVQKPAILAGEGSQTTLSADGTKLTITAADGYEITDVLLNGTSKGSVTELSGLKTGDKVEIKTAKKAEPAVPGKPTDPTNPSTDESIKKIKEGVENTSITLESKLTKNKKILLSWTKSRGYKVDRFQIYRSVKKNSGYGKKAFFATGNGEVSTYLNTKNLRTGKTYYYKLRGVRTMDDKKYYTQWSNKAWRTVK